MADQLSQDFKQFQDVIDKQVQLFGEHILPFLAKKIEGFNVKASGELLRSLQQSFTKEQALAAALKISFLKYGTATESKKYYLKNAPIDDIKAWVAEQRAKGNFKAVPGYVFSRKTPTESMAVNRIAWQLKSSRRNDRRSQRISPWFYKPFYSELKTFTDNLAGLTTDEVGKGVYRLIDRGVKQMNSNGR